MDRLTPPDPPPGDVRPRNVALRVGLGLGVGVAAMVGVAWLARVPLADVSLRAAVAGRGVDADWRLASLDFGGATLNDLRVGPAEAPALTAEALQLRWGFGRITAVRAEAPVVRLRWTEKGIETGALEPLLSGDAEPGQPLPDLRLTVVDGTLRLEGEKGALVARVTADGVLTKDFQAVATIADGTVEGKGGVVSGLDLTARAASEADALGFTLETAAARVLAPGAEAAASGAALSVRGRLAYEGGRLEVTGTGGAETLAAGPYAARQAEMGATYAQNGAGGWTLTLTHATPEAGLAGVALNALKGEAQLKGAGTEAAGTWRMGADAAMRAVTSPATVAAGDVTLKAGALRIAGAVEGPRAALTAEGRRTLDRALPSLDGTPAGPLMAAAKPALARAGAAFAFSAPVRLEVEKGAATLTLPGPAALRAASGAVLEAAPAADGPLLRWTPASGAPLLAGTATLTGAGLPNLTLALEALELSPAGAIRGELRLPDWAAADARLALPALRAEGTLARFTVRGDLLTSGPLAGGRAEALAAPLALRVERNARGLTLAPEQDGLTLSAARLETPVGRLDAVRLPLAPAGEAFLRIDPEGAVSGGFTTGAATLRGPETELGWAGARFALGAQPTFAIDSPRYVLRPSPERAVRLEGRTLEGALTLDGPAWRADGVIEAATLTDPALPVNAADMRLAWAATPAAGAVVLAFKDGAALVTDKEAKPRFQPLRIREITGTLAEGEVRSQGAIALEAGGAPLGAFESTHALETGEGSADILVRRLTFAPGLELDHVSQLALGVVASVRGSVDGDFQARWTRETFAADGRLTLNAVDAATLGLGPIEDVSGTIQFDDLTLLTTPPGQALTVGSVNPGVRVERGAVRFQLLENTVVALEDARFPFASGVLSLEPTQIVIGAARSDYRVRLTDVDMAALVAVLNLKDLTATGRAEGDFPLIITPTGARIENGVLRAAPGGGVIAYTGEFGADQSGPARIAFDALRSFRYDNLSLTLNGDLDGEIVSQIRFGGVNMAPIDPGIPIPGAARVGGTSGLPFRFNVTVTAPFQALLNETERLLNPVMRLEDAAIPALDPEKIP